MSSTCIWPAILQFLTQHSNQLSYAAAQNYRYLLYKQTFSDKTIHNRQQFFVTHLHKRVTIFKKLTQKFSILTSKKQKIALQQEALFPDPRFLLYYSYTDLLK